jgi:hypothetical protein
LAAAIRLNWLNRLGRLRRRIRLRRLGGVFIDACRRQ